MMKKTIKLLISTTLALSFVATSAACSFEDTLNGLLEDPMGTIGGIFNPDKAPEEGGEQGGETPDDGEQGGETPDDGEQGGETPDGGEQGGETPDGGEQGGVQEVKITVSYDENGGAELADEEIVVGATYTLKTPEREGYDFKGWFDDSANDYVAATGTWTGTVNVTLKAVWEAETYTVKFVSEGSVAVPADMTIEYGATYDVTTTANILPTRTGYTFTGWYVDAEKQVTPAISGTWTISDKYDGTDDNVITMTAQWEVIEYTIVYENLDGQTTENPTTFTAESAETTLGELENLDRTFNGWTVNGKAIEKLDASIIDEADENNVITITATWGSSCWTGNY